MTQHTAVIGPPGGLPAAWLLAFGLLLAPAANADDDPTLQPAGAVDADGVTIDPTGTAAYNALRIWRPKAPPPDAPVQPYSCRIVSYADKWTRHGLSNYMSWRAPNGPLADHVRGTPRADDPLVYSRDFDVDGDGQTSDDFAASLLFSLKTPLSNPRWPLHLAYPERFNEIFYGGASWRLANTEPHTHRVWIEQGYNPDHSPPWFDRRAEDHPLQGQANEYEIGSGLRLYWAIVWKKEDFLNDGDKYRVALDDDSRLAAITARGYWLGYDDVRMLVQDGGRWFISDTSQYEAPVRGYPPPANGRVFQVAPTRAGWAEYHPGGHRIDFDPAKAEFQTRSFHDVQAVGWYLAKDSLRTGSQAHLKWYGFEADAVVVRPEQPSVHLEMVETPAARGCPAFWISSCEVPYALWKRIHRWGNAPFNTLQKRYVYRKFGDMGSARFEPPGSRRAFRPDEPVTNITFYDALAWCNTLSEYEGKTPCYYVDPQFTKVFRNQHLWTRLKMNDKGERTRELAPTREPIVYVRWEADGHRLPTESEWRAAFRAGRTEADPASANVGAVRRDKTAAVGGRKPNQLGVYDMIGNVWEPVWNCGDSFDPQSHARITLLGGDFHFPADPEAAASAASPYGDRPYEGGGNIGLRLVCRRAGLPPPDADASIRGLGYHGDEPPVWVVDKNTKTAARRTDDSPTRRLLDMVPIPAGGFPFSPGGAPPVPTTVHPLKMARFATTFDQWVQVRRWAAQRGYRFSHTGDMGSMYWYLFDHCAQEPVTHIPWLDIVAWCNALSEMEGRTPCYYADAQRKQVYRQAMTFRPARMSGREAVRRDALKKYEPFVNTIGGETDERVFTRWDADGYRLPTLAEYEFAARGGGASRDYWGAEARDEYSWSMLNAGGRTHPVGQKEPNGYGLYDINGNVTHWIHSTDRLALDQRSRRRLDNPRMDPFDDDPTGRLAGPLAVGDSFLSSRIRDYPLALEMYYPDVGFRVVRCEPDALGRDDEAPIEDSETAASEPIASGAEGARNVVATDACWRGNVRRTGEYPTRGAPALHGLKWKFSAGGKVRSGPVVFEGVVYVGSEGGAFYALDAETGREQWRVDVAGGVRSSACVADGLVYFGGNDGRLYAADSQTGRVAWTASCRDFLSTSPVVAHGLLFMSGPVGFDPKTGQQVWRRPGARWTGFRYAIERSVAVAGRRLVEGGGACDLDSETFQFGGGTWARQATDAVSDGVIFTCQTGVGGGMYGDRGSGELHAVDLQTGRERWVKITHRDGAPQAWREVLMCSPAVHDGVVYVGSEHGELFALDAATGAPVWSLDVGAAIRSAPSISTRDRTLYFGAGDGRLYALDARSGRKKWEFPTGGAIVSSACPDRGCVYVGSDDGWVYAVE